MNDEKCTTFSEILNQHMSHTQRLHLEDSLLSVLNPAHYFELQECRKGVPKDSGSILASYDRISNELVLIYKDQILRNNNQVGSWIEAGLFSSFESRFYACCNSGVFKVETQNLIQYCDDEFRKQILFKYDNETDPRRKYWLLEWLYIHENKDTPEGDKRRITYQECIALDDQNIKVKRGVKFTDDEWKSILKELKARNETTRDDAVQFIKRHAGYEQIPSLLPFATSKKEAGSYFFSARLNLGSVSKYVRKEVGELLLQFMSNYLDQSQSTRRRYRNLTDRKVQIKLLKELDKAYAQQELPLKDFYPIFLSQYLKKIAKTNPEQFTTTTSLLDYRRVPLLEHHFNLYGEERVFKHLEIPLQEMPKKK